MPTKIEWKNFNVESLHCSINCTRSCKRVVQLVEMRAVHSNRFCVHKRGIVPLVMWIVVNRPNMRYIEVFILMVTSTSIRFFSLASFSISFWSLIHCAFEWNSTTYMCKSFYSFFFVYIIINEAPRRCEKWNENCTKRTKPATTHMSYVRLYMCGRCCLLWWCL